MLESLVIIVCLAIDQLTKRWAAATLLTLPNGTLPIIPDVLHLTYVENTGAAFGMLQNQRPFFIVVTCVVTIAIAGYLIAKRKSMGLWARVALSLMLTGALGNFIDRLWLHYVRDFVDFRLIRFAVFNVADACLTISVIMVAIYVFFLESRENREKSTLDAAPDAQGGTP